MKLINQKTIYFFEKNSSFGIPSHMHKTNKFKEPLTYVNCNRCYEILVSDFVDLMNKGQVRLLQGNFTESDLRMIAKGVLSSTQIPRDIKKLFE